jgi:hypothetical protein
MSRTVSLVFLLLSVFLGFGAGVVGGSGVHELVHVWRSGEVQEVCYFGWRADDPQAQAWTSAIHLDSTEDYAMLAQAGLDAVALLLLSICIITLSGWTLKKSQ